ncbi:hypothetical protein CC86DRAFT_60371 [Ophiobolus disseminans]|uniref:Protein kinase domain-containing protein n=1 Tax=Ophiobolus disseminans TaxID=1469910 RepID=A0A6A6ZSP8_9PLEO|nr:hypothetical protein CC86DRAFT_60371 [Ophiobolus disseminans]
MTIANRSGSLYDKCPDLLRLGAWLFQKTGKSAVTLREIQICETLRQQPHPNICLYRGVTVGAEGLVTGLVFDRYDATLFDLVHEGRRFDAVACICDVEAGIKHLHSLGYIHDDLKPDNIFYSTRTGRFVLGDFDSAHRIGSTLQLKHGAIGWHPKPKSKDEVAVPGRDWYGFEVLKFWIQMKGGGNGRNDDVSPSTAEILEMATKMLERKVF